MASDSTSQSVPLGAGQRHQVLHRGVGRNAPGADLVLD